MRTHHFSAIFYACVAVTVVILGFGGNNLLGQTAPPGALTPGGPVPIVHPSGGSGTGGISGNSGMGGTLAHNPGTDKILNVLNYGALGNGSTDDSTAIQAALDASATTTPGQVYFPALTFLHSKPLRITGDHLQVFGAGRIISKLKQNYLGPAIVVDGYNQNALTYGAALVGTGNSLNTTSANRYINLHEAAYNPVVKGFSGLSAMDVEFWYKTPASFGSGFSYMLASSTANPGATAGQVGVFRFFTTNATGKLTFGLKLAGGEVTVESSALSTSTVYDVAGDYDGSTCRLFLNGTLAASSACTGTVKQTSFETMSVPSGLEINWPNGGWQTSQPLPGFIDAIHLSKVSRHTADYTPASSKPVADSNTILIENFDTTSTDGVQSATTGQGSAPQVYLTIYGGGIHGVDVHLHDMEMCSSTGAPSDGLMTFGWGGEYDHLNCGFAGYYGFAFPPGGVGTFYEHVHDNDVCVASAGSNAVVANAVGYFYGGNFTEGHIADNKIDCIGLVGSINYGNAIDESSNFVGAFPMIYPFVALNQVIYSMPFVDLEGADANMAAGMFIAVNASFPPAVVNGAQILTTAGIPMILVGGGSPPILNGLQDYTLVGAPNELVDFTLAPATLLPITNFTGLPNVVVSNMPQWISTPGCGGVVTLSGGSGTLTQSCINSASICTAIDTTTFSNAVTLGAPTGTAGGSAGTVALTGTSSDVIKVVCN